MDLLLQRTKAAHCHRAGASKAAKGANGEIGGGPAGRVGEGGQKEVVYRWLILILYCL